jgi:hypothetical protein
MFLVRGCPAYLRSNNGSEFTAARVKRFLKDLGVDTLFIEPGSPWENGYIESFNSRMRDELLDGELLLHVDETKYVVEHWQMDYNHYQPHSSMGFMTPAGFTELCRQAGCQAAYASARRGTGLWDPLIDTGPKKGADQLLNPTQTERRTTHTQLPSHNSVLSRRQSSGRPSASKGVSKLPKITFFDIDNLISLSFETC